MPIKVKNIKELSEADCYSVARSQGIMTKIVDFLKRHNEEAYTPKEIFDGLTEEASSQGIRFSKASIANALGRIKDNKFFPNVKKKGIYYWYET